MKDLLKKIGRFCENHVEKIVLVIVGVVCIWLFFTRVIFSPNVVAIKGKSFTPGQIDRYVFEEKAQELSAQLRRKKTGDRVAYTPRLTGPVDPCDNSIAGLFNRPLPRGFAGLLESPLDFIDTTAVPRRAAAPAARVASSSSSRQYRLPTIPDVTDVAATHLRATAYVPRQPVTPEAKYTSSPTEPNDIDLVTVEARFDTAELYRRFQASFNGVDVQKEEWRDPCLADPTFAAVQLERQEQLEDGSWGAWQAIPRSRVESNRELFSVIDRVEDLPVGGMGVRMMQYEPKMVTLSLLQPESYQIASADEDWLPPSFYGKFKDLQKKVEAEERREQKEQERAKDDRTATDTRRGDLRGGIGGTGTQGTAARGTRGRPGTGVGGDTGMRGSRGTRGTTPGGEPGMPGTRARGSRRAGAGDDMYGDMYGARGMGPDGRRKASTTEVYYDFREEMLNYRTDLSKQPKPTLIWVFDDTARPGKTYQYRVRVGVFNPVAGTGQLVERDKDKNNQAILWSRYSQIAGPISIPRMVYLFAKSVQDKTKTATVEVARYTMGYWRTEDFQVKPGEAIGKPVEPKDKRSERDKERERRQAMMGPGGGRITDPRGGMLDDPMYNMAPDPAQANQPKVIDYTTGTVLVDLVEVNDWADAPNLRPRMYHDMLYTTDGTRIEHMPVSMTNWPRDLTDAYQVVQSEKRREPKPFRAFSTSARGGRGTQDAYGGGEGMYPGMEGGGPYPY
ncbi:MAG TPA: hypothetical protein PKH24_01890 [Sedimentisphaerales bacterium]|jgi:hypothetical protein|nr:hypothetical protein [Sedimentisphaerales bacterium]HNU28242.1 hypothetical protein [Sedimentisphaerales bacterium]